MTNFLCPILCIFESRYNDNWCKHFVEIFRIFSWYVAYNDAKYCGNRPLSDAHKSFWFLWSDVSWLGGLVLACKSITWLCTWTNNITDCSINVYLGFTNWTHRDERFSTNWWWIRYGLQFCPSRSNDWCWLQLGCKPIKLGWLTEISV